MPICHIQTHNFRQDETVQLHKNEFVVRKSTPPGNQPYPRIIFPKNKENPTLFEDLEYKNDLHLFKEKVKQYHHCNNRTDKFINDDPIRTFETTFLR